LQDPGRRARARARLLRPSAAPFTLAATAPRPGARRPERPGCAQALTGARASPPAALAALEAMFGGGGAAGSARGGGAAPRVTVLLVDEMDLLVTRKQSVRARAATLTPGRGGGPSALSLMRARAEHHFRAGCHHGLHRVARGLESHQGWGHIGSARTAGRACWSGRQPTRHFCCAREIRSSAVNDRHHRHP